MQEVSHVSWRKLERQQKQIDEMAEQLRQQQALLESQTAELKELRCFFQHPQPVAPVMTCHVIAET